jgi:hypothetical protein
MYVLCGVSRSILDLNSKTSRITKKKDFFYNMSPSHSIPLILLEKEEKPAPLSLILRKGRGGTEPGVEERCNVIVVYGGNERYLLRSSVRENKAV